MAAEYCPEAQMEHVVELTGKPLPWVHFGLEHVRSAQPAYDVAVKAALVFQASAIAILVQSDSAVGEVNALKMTVTASTSHK